MKNNIDIRKVLTELCPAEVVREVYPCVANIPNLEFKYSESKRMAQTALQNYRRDTNVLLPSYFPLYGNSLLGVDIVLKGELNILLVSYHLVKDKQLQQRNILMVVKEGDV